MTNEELKEMIKELTPENREKFWNYYLKLLKEQESEE